MAYLRPEQIRERLERTPVAFIPVGPLEWHGAENHMATLARLATEITRTTGPRVHVRIAAPKRLMEAGSGGHADTGETSLMMHLTRSVDLSALPPLPERLPFKDHAVVNGPGFDGKVPDHVLPDASDPRRHASAESGREGFCRTVEEIEQEVRSILTEMGVEADGGDGPTGS